MRCLLFVSSIYVRKTCVFNSLFFHIVHFFSYKIEFCNQVSCDFKWLSASLLFLFLKLHSIDFFIISIDRKSLVFVVSFGPCRFSTHAIFLRRTINCFFGVSIFIACIESIGVWLIAFKPLNAPSPNEITLSTRFKSKTECSKNVISIFIVYRSIHVSNIFACHFRKNGMGLLYDHSSHGGVVSCDLCRIGRLFKISVEFHFNNYLSRASIFKLSIKTEITHLNYLWRWYGVS